MLFNSEALFEEDGSIDHHIDVVLWLGQRMVVVVDVHLHCFAQCLDKFRYLKRESGAQKIIENAKW